MENRDITTPMSCQGAPSASRAQSAPTRRYQRRAGTCHQHHRAVPMTDSSHSMNPRGARLDVSFTHARRRSKCPRLHALIDKCHVEIVGLKGTYVRNAGVKSATILDGAELCRIEEFAARHFRRSGFEATFLQSAPFHVLFGVYFWSVIQDRCDRRVRTVGILDRHAYDQRRPSEVIWIRLPSDFGSPDYSRRRAKAITKHLSAIGETRAELLELFDNWLAPSVGLRQYLWAHRRESIETARKLIELIPPVILKTVLGYLVLNYWGHYSGWPDLLVYRTNQWFLAEVKSWRDKLNENQKRWIEDNHRYLHLPFKLVQVARGGV